MLGDDRVEGLVPAERVRRDDRRAVAADDRQQLGQADARRHLVEVGQAVDEEVPLARRDLRPREDPQAAGPGRQVGQLVGPPLVVVLGDHQAVEADREGVLDQLPRVDDAIRGVAGGVQVMVEFRHVSMVRRVPTSAGDRAGSGSTISAAPESSIRR